jgi:glycine/D-amino acid oxidase-like deaminating enzyme
MSGSIQPFKCLNAAQGRMPVNEELVIVGAGLCGTLLALVLAEKGHKVVIYESRQVRGSMPLHRVPLCSGSCTSNARSGQKKAGFHS